MFVFLMSQLPLPIMLFLNWRVSARYARVKELSKSRPLSKPKRLVWGFWLNNAATAIAIIPSLVEWRVFVQDHRWLLLYGFTASLTVSGLLLMNSGLGKELRILRSRRGLKASRVKAVDTEGTDTI